MKVAIEGVRMPLVGTKLLNPVLVGCTFVETRFGLKKINEERDLL
jgi:hypothetical protein